MLGSTDDCCLAVLSQLCRLPDVECWDGFGITGICLGLSLR